MLGYVVADKPELKLREFEVYNGYYCGVCKSIGRRYGQLPRFVLSYDSAFLAILASSMDSIIDVPSREHCIIHPIKKKTIVRNEVIDYAADVMLILAWYKLEDDINDEGKVYARVIHSTMKHIYRKLKAARPKLCDNISQHLRELSLLEQDKCPSIDRAAEAFALIMTDIFYEAPLSDTISDIEREAFSRLGYHLGKWIYIIDAMDDIEENIGDGAYNPLLYRYNYHKEETAAGFKERISQSVSNNLYIYLGEMSKCLDLLPIKKYNGIITNVLYLGLNRKTQQIVTGEE